MRYAVISDTHGNAPGFQAVLDDARRQKVDGYFLLGDYYNDFPYPNQTVEQLRSLAPAVCIAGNKEESLAHWLRLPKAQWTKDQYAAVFWNLETLTPENLQYLLELPTEKTLTLEGHRVVLQHASLSLFGSAEDYPLGPLRELTCSVYAPLAKEGAFESLPYSEYLAQRWQSHPSYKQWLSQTPPGVYLFGHSHVQWHVALDGRLLINAGSCGHPLDLDPRAPYTIITLSPGKWQVEERRVAYDRQPVLKETYESSLYQAAPVWVELAAQEFQTATPCLRRFFTLAGQIAKETGENTTHGISNPIWRETGERWLRQHPSVFEEYRM